MRRLTLDDAANVALILTCVATLGVLGARYVWPSEAPLAGAKMFKAGEAGPELKGINYESHDQTLVLYLRASCGLCTESMPFYRDLLRRHEPARLGVVAASIDPVETSKEYLRSQHVEMDAVVVTPARGVPTPTLLLVDRTGSVIDFWVGKQPPDGEGHILQALGRRGALKTTLEGR